MVSLNAYQKISHGMLLFLVLVPINIMTLLGLIIYNWKHLKAEVFQGAIDNAIKISPKVKEVDEKIVQNEADILQLRVQNGKLRQQKKQISKDVARETTAQLREVTDVKPVMQL